MSSQAGSSLGRMVGGREEAQCEGWGRSGDAGRWGQCTCVAATMSPHGYISFFPLLPQLPPPHTVWILQYLLSLRSQKPSPEPSRSPFTQLPFVSCSEAIAAGWRGRGSLALEDGGVEKGKWDGLDATWLFLIFFQPWTSKNGVVLWHWEG